ncbi:hypothetical protein [Cytobacillus praedii]|nr:hypothetical protein [Cytobacillus praedii]
MKLKFELELDSFLLLEFAKLALGIYLKKMLFLFNRDIIKST